MCLAWVFEAWPLGGPAIGGSTLYLRTIGADHGVVHQGVIFSFGHDDVRLRTRNVTFHSATLVEVVTPSVPPTVGLLPRTARVYFACSQKARQSERRDLGQHIATFTFWLDRPSRLPLCFDASNCDRPPALLDIAAGVTPRAAARLAGMSALAPRVLPPGGRCEDWRALRGVRGPPECQRAATLVAARWDGVAPGRPQSFAGCTLWRSARGPGFVRFIQAPPQTQRSAAANAACDITSRGGHCLCVGPSAAKPLQTPCGQSLSALFGFRKDLAHASSTLHDPCEAPSRARPCLSKVLQQLPAPGFHELEDSSVVGYLRRIEGSFNLDVVVALHSTPMVDLVDAIHEALSVELARATTVYVYQKGQLPPKERRRLANVRHLTVRIERLVNVGRCDHSYLTHITRHFSSLAKLTLFVKDTTFAHLHLGYGSKLLTFLRRLPAPVDFWGARALRRAGPDFEMEEYVSDICRNRFVKRTRGQACYKSDFEYLRAESRPLGVWRMRMGLGNETTYKFVPGGIFAASAKAIRRTPLAIYERMLQDVGRGPNVEAGHFMERSWFAAFNGPHQRTHRPIVRLRSTLAVYTIVLAADGGRDVAVGAPPCDDTFAAKTAGMSTVECLFFSDSPMLLEAAQTRGWRTSRIAHEHEARVLKRAPHRHTALAAFDYSAFYVASAGRTLNVPAVLEAIGGRFLTSSAASMLLPAPIRAQTAGTETSVSTAAIVRRQTGAVAALGDAWLNASSVAHSRAAGLADDDRSLQQVLARQPQPFGLPAVLVLPSENSLFGSNDVPLLLIPPAELPTWWTWWMCVSKGHGSADTGRARLSRCCKPGTMESRSPA